MKLLIFWAWGVVATFLMSKSFTWLKKKYSLKFLAFTHIHSFAPMLVFSVFVPEFRYANVSKYLLSFLTGK